MKLAAVFASFLFCAASAFGQQEAPQETPKVQMPAPVEQPTADDKKDPEKVPPKGVIHLQLVKNPPEVHATQPCNNFAWAAALAGVLAYEKAEIAQDVWVDKLYGGSFCLEEIGTMEEIQRKVQGEYTLDDGRHVEISLQYFDGVPSNTSALLVPIMSDEVLILMVEGKPNLLIGAMWDDWLSKRGERMIDLKELMLVDPLAAPGKERVTLHSEDFPKISGFVKVTAQDVHQQYWPK